MKCRAIIPKEGIWKLTLNWMKRILKTSLHIYNSLLILAKVFFFFFFFLCVLTLTQAVPSLRMRIESLGLDFTTKQCRWFNLNGGHVTNRCKATQYFYDAAQAKKLLSIINDYETNRKQKNLPILLVSPFGGSITKVRGCVRVCRIFCFAYTYACSNTRLKLICILVPVAYSDSLTIEDIPY